MVDYVVNNWDNKSDIHFATSVEFQYRNVAHYESYMGMENTYGTDLEIHMLTKLKLINLFEKTEDGRIELNATFIVDNPEYSESFICMNL